MEGKEQENELANPSTSPKKRKRAATEDSTDLGALFDSLAPSPSSRVILRPPKIAKCSNDAVARDARAVAPSSEKSPDLESARLSVTEPLEKRMEVCFGVVPTRSVAALAHPQQCERSDADS